MSTTTIRLPEELKARIARAAERAGTTSHNFILEAIAEKAELTERHNEFLATADARYAAIAATGKTVSWQDMQRYLTNKVAGKRAARPVAKKLTR
jgi:predicted transcriptional regulator